MGGVWGTVCDDMFNVNAKAAQVACRQLQMTGGQVDSISKYGEGSLPIFMDDTICTGAEAGLGSCKFNIVNNCKHSEDVAIACGEKALSCRQGAQVVASGQASGWLC